MQALWSCCQTPRRGRTCFDSSQQENVALEALALSKQARYTAGTHYFIPGWGSKPRTNSLYSAGRLFVSSRGDSDSSPRHRRVPPATCAPNAGKTGSHLTTPEQGPKIIPQKLHVSMAALKVGPRWPSGLGGNGVKDTGIATYQISHLIPHHSFHQLGVQRWFQFSHNTIHIAASSCNYG